MKDLVFWVVMALNAWALLLVFRRAHVQHKIDVANIKRKYPEVCLPSIGFHHWTPWRPDGIIWDTQSRSCTACGKVQERKRR